MNKHEQKDDRALLAEAAAGDFEAFEVLVERYQNQLYRLALSMTRNPAEAEEVVQEAFLSVFRALDTYRGEAAPRTWIFRIATNAALIRLRRRKRKPFYSVEDNAATALGGKGVWDLGNWSQSPDEQILGKEMRDKLSEAVASLPEDYSVVLHMRDVEGLSNAEVGDALGLSLAAVKSRLHRARLVVRAAIERYLEGQDMLYAGETNG